MRFSLGLEGAQLRADALCSSQVWAGIKHIDVTTEG